jgi:hypothetical protein
MVVTMRLDDLPDAGASGGASGPWLFGIARNKLADSVRRGRVEEGARRRLALDTSALVIRKGQPRPVGAARPTGGDPMTLLPDLEAQLRDAARRTQPAAFHAHRARRTLLIALAVALAIASVAVAAIQIGTGADAPRLTSLGSPYLGPGRVLAGQSHAIDARADDPDGGPQWGVRAYRTSRRGACWQVGRVLGRLGVLGCDGLLGDDGRFHALPLQVDRCRPLDGAGHLFVFQDALAQENGIADRQTCRPAALRADDRKLRSAPRAARGCCSTATSGRCCRR